MHGLLENETGPLSDSEVRIYLNECLGKGWIRISNEEYKVFDPIKNGCPGHELKDD